MTDKTINFINSGSNVILNGNGNQGLFIIPIFSGNTVTSSISGIDFLNCQARGGDGNQRRGGGGLGAGGAIFIANGATVSIAQSNMSSCSAIGGGGGGGAFLRIVNV